MDMIGGNFFADAKFASFKNVGDELIGVIVEGKEAQATYKGKPQFWPLKPGQDQADPKMELRLTVRKDDGAEEILTVPRDKNVGSRQQAIKDAVRSAGLDGLPLNARLKIVLTEKQDNGNGGTRNVYKAALKAPELSVD